MIDININGMENSMEIENRIRRRPSWGDRQPARHCTLLQLGLGFNGFKHCNREVEDETVNPRHYVKILLCANQSVSMFQWLYPTWIILWCSFVLSPVDSTVLIFQFSIVFTHSVCELVLWKEIISIDLIFLCLSEEIFANMRYFWSTE